ncbi:unnamed protein product [Lepeophtheirus salmonis]|uniref:(salmon louse) hypothetical protein n=1 Tax=Lepeophtheirus salmonis TaxID=72036 RepID=A0A7R8CRP4_LEPSM|nr:unnamed protein product [Lepeophtheirus salmonis]CAF2907657.1 unnamed protein product [Lepeophtheirus salmonis]
MAQINLFTSILLQLLVLTFGQDNCKTPLNHNDFSPCIIAQCIGDTINITVNTLKPFEGIVHGGLKTSFRIDIPQSNELASSSSSGSALNQTSKCGVKYNSRTNEYYILLVVREHSTIELAKDKHYFVGCKSSGYTNSLNEKSLVKLRVTRPEDTDNRAVSLVLEGQEYKLAVNTINPDESLDLMIHSCFAFSERGDDRQELINKHGCPVNDILMSEFTYSETKGMASADLYMFRLPSSNKTYFQCDVTLCKGCPRPDCSQNFGKNEDLIIGSNSTLTTSTSVFVVEPGTPGSADGLLFCPVASESNADDYIKYLCIAFGVLFLIMSLINICLCFTMTCSCTKSEVIEKEPSIYSIYDSQYGYANGKAYGSESEYGSEYGAVDNQNYEEDDEYDERRPPSDTDTYHSKYSHHRRH